MIPRQISISEKAFVNESVKLGVRSDGRTRMDHRFFNLKTDVIPNASGSARLQLAQTDVLVTVKVEIGDTEADSPDSGRVVCSVECAASLAVQLEAFEAQNLTAELTNILEKFLVKSDSIPVEQLCIIPGKTCWVIGIDALVLASDGNISDALMFASKAALKTTCVPHVQVIQGENSVELDVSDDPSDVIALECENVPLCVTLAQIGPYFILDATQEEENCMSAGLLVGVDPKGEVCGLHTLGLGAFPSIDLVEMLRVARRVGLALNAQLASILSARS